LLNRKDKMMAKQNEQIKIMDQIIKRMEKHNLAEAKVGNIHLKKENPQDIADTVKQRELSEKEQEEARRLARIRCTGRDEPEEIPTQKTG